MLFCLLGVTWKYLGAWVSPRDALRRPEGPQGCWPSLSSAGQEGLGRLGKHWPQHPRHRLQPLYPLPEPSILLGPPAASGTTWHWWSPGGSIISTNPREAKALTSESWCFLHTWLEERNARPTVPQQTLETKGSEKLLRQEDSDIWAESPARAAMRSKG